MNDQQVISCIDNLQQGDLPCKNIVIVGLFSSLNGKQEEHVAHIIEAHCPNVSVTLSHQVSSSLNSHFGGMCILVSHLSLSGKSGRYVFF